MGETMPVRKLPATPDFEAIELAARASADRRSMILEMIGQIVLSWSNNESMLIYLLMLLLDTDQTSATIVFATLNTTRARLDLIERLAKAKLKDRAIVGELDGLLTTFNKCTRMRNEFNHCIYTFNDSGELTHTHSLRFQEVRGRMRMGTVKAMDARRVQEMQASIATLTALNRDLWRFLQRLDAHLAERASNQGASTSPA